MASAVWNVSQVQMGGCNISLHKWYFLYHKVVEKGVLLNKCIILDYTILDYIRWMSRIISNCPEGSPHLSSHFKILHLSPWLKDQIASSLLAHYQPFQKNLNKSVDRVGRYAPFCDGPLPLSHSLQPSDMNTPWHTHTCLTSTPNFLLLGQKRQPMDGREHFVDWLWAWPGVLLVAAHCCKTSVGLGFIHSNFA